MTCLGLAEHCSYEHRSPRWGGDMYCTHSLFSVVHTVRMVTVICFCAFHAVRMGVFCGCFDCTHTFKVVRMVVIRLYIGVFC